ncbi:MAG: ABC transporter substrate-binding protein [Solirubrobacteraceae bacterium]|nr:ABC transporter substrate-binding protein [Solirubrobacteraceae bacterium]
MIQLSRQRSLPYLVALSAAATTLFVAGCGQMEEQEAAVTQTDDVTLVLDYFPNANHAAIYAAQAGGAFERAGLNVTIQPPADAAAPLKTLAADQADFVISYEPEILLARNEGAKIQGVQALVQKPLTSVMSLPGKNAVREPKDFAGKTVGTSGLNYQAAYLDTILDEGGVNPSRVKRVDLGFSLSAPLIAGRVDATLGGFWNYEAIELERKKKDPIVRRIEELGVPNYNELVITATEETVRDRGPLVRRFVQAIGFGAKAVQADPAAGIDPLMQASKGLDRGLQEASLKATLPVMFPENKEQPFGWLDPVEWTTYANWMQERGLITSSRIAARATTNEYLAGQGVGDRTDS